MPNSFDFLIREIKQVTSATWKKVGLAEGQSIETKRDDLRHVWTQRDTYLGGILRGMLILKAAHGSPLVPQRKVSSIGYGFSDGGGVDV